MEWSHSNLKKVVATGVVVSVFAVAVIIALRSATEQVQVAAGICLVVVAFVASMAVTRRKPTERASHHRVSHIPLPSQPTQQAA